MTESNSATCPTVVAKTAAGNIPISTIPFDNIATTFPGIDGFGGKATIPASELYKVLVRGEANES